MTYKEKAKELIDFYVSYVHGYTGSSMLTNTEFPELVLQRAKECAIYNVDGILEALKVTTNHLSLTSLDENEVTKDFGYWFQVRQVILDYDE